MKIKRQGKKADINQSEENSTKQKQKFKNITEFFKKIPDFLVSKRKSVIVVCCLAIICTAVYVDWRVGYNGGDTANYIYTGEVGGNTKMLGEAKLVSKDGDVQSETDKIERDEFFVNAQINRKRSRDESVAMFQSVVDSSETMPDVKDKALGEIMTIAQDISKEASVEEMIKAKGFEDCIAVISGDSINVIVKTSGLLTNEVAQIKEIVMKECGFAPENIKIIEKF